MSFDNKTCPHKTCLVITRHVMWSKDTSCDQWHELWSQDASCDHKISRVITRHVLWSQDMFCDQKTCLVITSRALRSQDMSRDHQKYLVITRLVSRSHVCDHKTCLVITRHVDLDWLWSHDMSYDYRTRSYDHRTGPGKGQDTLPTTAAPRSRPSAELGGLRAPPNILF